MERRIFVAKLYGITKEKEKVVFNFKTNKDKKIDIKFNFNTQKSMDFVAKQVKNIFDFKDTNIVEMFKFMKYVLKFIEIPVFLEYVKDEKNSNVYIVPNNEVKSKIKKSEEK